MLLELTDDQHDFATAVADFCRKEAGTREQRAKLTDNGRLHHNPDLSAQIARLGWPGIRVPEAYGGQGGSHVDMCLLLEGTSYGMLPVAGMGVTLIVGNAVARFGSESQKELLLGSIAAGESHSISMSEPGAGSDVGALTCRAERTETGWRINGQKTWCSNAHYASHLLLVARTSREGGKHEGITMFHVPIPSPGLEVRGISTLGGTEVNDLFFTDCDLPADAVIGEVGQGWRQLMSGLNTERLILGGLMMGLAQRAFDDCLEFVTTREQFGRKVGSFQVLRHRLADLATEIEATRLMVYAVARAADREPDRVLAREASMVKLKSTEVAKKMAIEGMQMMGGYGYATEFDMEKHLRSAIISTVYGGTNEIQRDIIGKTFGL